MNSSGFVPLCAQERRLRQFRVARSFVDDPGFTFAVEGEDKTSFAQGIWCEIMAIPGKPSNLMHSVPAYPLTGLGSLQASAQKAGSKGLPPVHLWNPPYCGDIGMKITRDGTWHYQGSPIGRLSMVKLFASILRRDPDRYVLVTPVEKVAVEVEDAPFLAVEMKVERAGSGAVLTFRTNVDDLVSVDSAHRMRFERGAAEGIKPYVNVRAGLWALVTRPLLYDLVELGDIRQIDGEMMFGVESSGEFFPMAPAADMDALEIDAQSEPNP